MLNAIPFLGWFLSVLFAASTAVPFWFIWSFCAIGKTYFYFVPERFQYIPFLDCIGLFIVLSIIKATLVPSLATVTNTNTNGK